MFSNEDLCAAPKGSGVQNIAASKKGGEDSGVLCAWHIVHHLEGGVGVQVCTYCNLKGEEVLVCYTLCIGGGGVQVCKCAREQGGGVQGRKSHFLLLSDTTAPTPPLT